MDNPYLIQGPALISFSGGRTSAYMLKHIVDAHSGTLPDDVRVVFANTGLEHPATMDFVRDCGDRWGVEIVWLEFDAEAEHRTRIVSYETASRDGRPLREVIETRPTPHLFNPVSRYCSPTAKARRIQKYGHKWMGWDRWIAVVGLRADEMRRVDRLHARSGRDREITCTPLATAGVTKEMVSAWWAERNFDLQLPNVAGVTPMGNCVCCPLKSRKKLVAALREMPEAADWWIAQEEAMEERLRASGLDLVGLKRRHRFHADYTSYRELLEQAQSTPACQLEMFDDAGALDCSCTE